MNEFEKLYQERLLELCTEKQKNIFKRMYPSGVKESHLKTSIPQIERTIKNLNSSREEMRECKKQLSELENVNQKMNKNVNNAVLCLTKLSEIHENCFVDAEFFLNNMNYINEILKGNRTDEWTDEIIKSLIDIHAEQIVST